MIMRLKEVAEAYLQSSRRGDAPHLGSPWENIQDEIDRDPVRAWRLILWIVALARDPLDIAIVGTGPLETFLVRYEHYVDAALRLAARHESFREALSSADIRGAAPAAVARVHDFFSSK